MTDSNQSSRNAGDGDLPSLEDSGTFEERPSYDQLSRSEFLQPIDVSANETEDAISQYAKAQLPTKSHAKPWAIIAGIILATLAYWIGREYLGEMPARGLSIFVLASVFWATEALPLYATAFVAIGLEVVFLAAGDGGMGRLINDVMLNLGLLDQATVDTIMADPIKASTFFAPLSKNVIILFMGGFLISAAVTKHGLDMIIASKMLRPFVHSPILLLYAVMGISAFFSMWMSNTATTAMMIAIIMPVAARIRGEARFTMALILAVPFGANIGGIGTPIGTPPNAIALGAMAQAGFQVSFLQWMMVAVPLVIILLAALGIVLYVFFRPTGTFKMDAIETPAEMTGRGKLTLLVMAMAILLWLTGEFHGLGSAAVALLAAAALTALGVLGRKDVDSIDWNVLILMWGGLSLATVIDVSGLKDIITGLNFAGLPGGAIGLAVVISFVSLTIASFMSHTATAGIVVPLALALSVPDGNVGEYAMLAALACSFAMALPVSTPPNAIAFATGKIPIGNMVAIGSVVSIGATILMLAGYKIIFPLVLDKTFSAVQ